MQRIFELRAIEVIKAVTNEYNENDVVQDHN